MEQVACNLCGSRDSRPLWTLPDLFLDHHDVTATFVRCAACGLIYQDPRPTLTEMAIHYPSEYESYDAEPEANSSWLQRQSIQHGVAKRVRVVMRYKQSGRLLDIGCAAGVFLRGIADRGGWQVCGVEVSEYAAQIARTRYGLDVRAGTLEQATFPDQFFDVVTLWDVLEHLHDPTATLREIHRILKPDGILVIRSPNARSWEAQAFRSCWAGLDPPRHLYVFTPVTLNALLAHSGFRVKAWTCRTGAYAMFLLSLRFWAGKHPSAWRHLLVRLMQNPLVQMTSVPVFYAETLRMRGPLMIATAGKSMESK